VQTIIKRPSSAFALAFVALFGALTGGAYAVATAPTDSVVSELDERG
jgi:hypothetical protein